MLDQEIQKNDRFVEIGERVVQAITYWSRDDMPIAHGHWRHHGMIDRLRDFKRLEVGWFQRVDVG
ncbi:hypothetical protein GCM10009075_13560 [Sphingomonas trueperi]